MEEPQWSYLHDGVAHGPVAFAELQELARGGRLAQTDMVLREGAAEWTPASTVEGLFPPPRAKRAEKNAFEFVGETADDEPRRLRSSEGGNHSKLFARLGLFGIAGAVLLGCIFCGCLQSFLRHNAR